MHLQSLLITAFHTLGILASVALIVELRFEELGLKLEVAALTRRYGLIYNVEFSVRKLEVRLLLRFMMMLFVCLIIIFFLNS